LEIATVGDMGKVEIGGQAAGDGVGERRDAFVGDDREAGQADGTREAQGRPGQALDVGIGSELNLRCLQDGGQFGLVDVQVAADRDGEEGSGIGLGRVG